MNRREFLMNGLFAGGAAMLGGCGTLCGNRARFKLAMAGYSLHTLKTDEALAFCEKHGFSHLCIKNCHLPFESTSAQIAEFRRKCADHGVTPYGVGPIYMCKREEVRRYFDYAAALGVDLIVGVPGKKTGPNWIDNHSDRGMCESCAQLADEYKVRYAIHNHGRNPKTGNPNLYPAVPETYELIKDLSPRMGFCVDWAYTYADGLDCLEVARKYAGRIFDGHVRCISDMKNGSSGTNPANRAFDFDGIFDALKEIGYDGCLGLELAAAFPDHIEWIDESRDYFEGLMR